MSEYAGERADGNGSAASGSGASSHGDHGSAGFSGAGGWFSASGGRFGRTPPHGDIAEEATKLVEAVQQWLAGHAAGPSSRRTGSDVWAEAVADDASTPPECHGCPICAVRRAMAGVSPEVYEHLADAVAALGAALRAMDPNRPHDRSP
jgi:hypothetical protein